MFVLVGFQDKLFFLLSSFCLFFSVIFSPPFTPSSYSLVQFLSRAFLVFFSVS